LALRVNIDAEQLVKEGHSTDANTVLTDGQLLSINLFNLRNKFTQEFVITTVTAENANNDNVLIRLAKNI